MNHKELFSILNLLPKEPEFGDISSAIDDYCPQVKETIEYKQWRKSAVRLDMYQYALTNVLEDQLEQVEDYEPESWRSERVG
jgi:hypothetical protein